jgi:glycosyltransferase involved in cell wall biosynthesis
MTPLPVTVIIPTLNCREKLERHLEDSKEWFPKVGQVIAVDSNSTDGTLELLRDVLTPYGAEIITTGPGLYRAWNLGVGKATQPYVYFSTIGEILEPHALEEMCRLIQTESCDVLISPPRMVDERGDSIAKQWPIHSMRELLCDDRITVLSADDLFLLSSLYIPNSIIGSSASNLYRGDVLRRNPFPENVGAIGDVIWALDNLPFLKVCFCGKMFATFCWDGDRKMTWEKSYQVLDFIRGHISNLIDEKRWPTDMRTLAIKSNISNKVDIVRDVSQLDQWINLIFSSRFNRFKINVIDSFSVREQWKKFFSPGVP